MILPPERLPANITRIGSFISVGPLMYQKIITLGKLSVAIFANKLFLGPHSTSSNLRYCRVPTWRPQIVKLVPGVVVDSRIPQPLVDKYGVIGRICVDRLETSIWKRCLYGIWSWAVPSFAMLNSNWRRQVWISRRVRWC